MRLVKNVAPALDIQELGEETEEVQWLQLVHDPSILC
jgi:hypothetical protein